MISRRKFSGLTLAGTAAGLFSAIPGQALAGKNSCKGMGFVTISRSACEKIGGKVKETED